MSIEMVGLIIAAFVCGAVAIATLMRNFKSRTFIFFALFVGLLFMHDALSVLETFDSGLRFSYPKLHALSVLLSGPALLLFLRAILPDSPNWLTRVIWGYSITVGVLAIATIFFMTPAVAPWAEIISHAIFLFPAGVWVYGLHYGVRKSRLARERIRFRFAFVTGAFTLAFFVTDAIAFTSGAIPPLATFARVLYVLFLFQVFIQKELLTAEEVVAKIALFGGVAVIFSTIYALLVNWVKDRQDLFFFNTLIASVAILVLYDPIQRLTTRFTRNLFLRRYAMLEKELNKLSIDLLGVVDPMKLAQLITDAVKSISAAHSAGLFLLDRDEISYVRVGPPESEATAEVPAASPLIEYMLLRRGRPFVLETVEGDRDSFYGDHPIEFCDKAAEEMRQIGSDFIIPFLHGSTVIAFCAARTGGTVVMSNEQLKLLFPVARQVAICLKNAQAYTEMKDRDKMAALGEMAAGLAHEIKNPLGAIKGAAELLKEGIDKGKGPDPEFLQIIQDESNRLSAVLTDFLDYAKPRKDYGQLSCDPLRVVELTVALLQREADIRVQIHSPGKRLSVLVDPEVLKQVLINLFLNAVQAMAEEPNPRMEVRVREIPARKPWFALPESIPLFKTWEGWKTQSEDNARSLVEIQVKDNGHGISSDETERIFLPFFTTKPRGTGLGLAVCQRLVEGMNGSIHVRRNYPRGAVFAIHLPMHREVPMGEKIETVQRALKPKAVPV